jgi:hypothetical protein
MRRQGNAELIHNTGQNNLVEYGSCPADPSAFRRRTGLYCRFSRVRVSLPADSRTNTDMLYSPTPTARSDPR